MNLLTKVLKVDGNPIEVYQGVFGKINVYKAGTTRTVRTYLLFPRKIEGIRVWGPCKLEQVAELHIDDSYISEGTILYNRWKDERVVEPN